MIDHNADGEAVDAAAEVLRARIAAEAAREVVVRLMAQRKARQAEHQTDLEQHAKQVHYSIYGTRRSYRTHHIRVHHTVHIIYEYIIPYTSYASTSYRTQHIRVHYTEYIIHEQPRRPHGQPHSGVLVTKSAFTYARKNIHSGGPRNEKCTSSTSKCLSVWAENILGSSLMMAHDGHFHLVNCHRAGVYWGCPPSAPMSLQGESWYQLFKLWSR